MYTLISILIFVINPVIKPVIYSHTEETNSISAKTFFRGTISNMKGQLLQIVAGWKVHWPLDLLYSLCV